MYPGERVNSISHLVGAALALGGMVVLIVFGALSGDGWKLGSGIVYGVSLLLMFLFSTLYHSFRGTPKIVFERLDHIGIYLLIAGTYTPFCLVTLRADSGFRIVVAVWSIAILGTVWKSIFGPRFNLVSTLLYVVAGWTIVLDIGTLWRRLPPAGFAWLVAGGVLYTLGAGFYLRDQMPRNHEIWHFFVLAAAGCHYVSVLFSVIL